MNLYCVYLATSNLLFTPVDFHRCSQPADVVTHKAFVEDEPDHSAQARKNMAAAFANPVYYNHPRADHNLKTMPTYHQYPAGVQFAATAATSLAITIAF